MSFALSRKSSVALLFLALPLIHPRVMAATASGTEGAAFLEIPVGAEPAALGSAYSALATNAYAPVWNPAGLGFLDSTQIAGQHLSYLESIYDEYLGAAFRLKEGRGLAFSAQYLGSGNIPGAALDGTVQPDYTSHFAAYSVAFGQRIGEKLSLGVTGKLINAKISDVSSNAYAGDLGALYKVSDITTLAATVTNLGSKLTFLNDDSSLPVTGRLGLALRPSIHWLLAVEGDYAKTGLASGHVGLQWKPIDMVSLRAGYRTDTTKELGAMAGLTLGAGLEVWGQEFAYAWLPMGDLGNTQYFSLLLRFGEVKKDKENIVHSQDIKRHRNASKDKEDIDPESQQLMELLKTGDEKTAQKRGSQLQELSQ